MERFARDRLTWLAYAMLGWFAYLQAAPGLIVPHLRDELHLSYSAGGRHVAAWAAGSLVAGLAAGALERRFGRRRLFWASGALLAAGLAPLTLGRVATVTELALLEMGVGGGLLLITIQALLADHHGARRAIALTEANVAAAVAYVVLIGGLGLAAATHAGWRAALLASLLVPVAAFAATRAVAIEAPAPGPKTESGRLPGAFWVAAAMMFCTTSAEWCITAWGASFVQHAAHVSADAGVSLMIGYFGGVLVGRVTGSRLTREHAPQRLLAIALAVTAGGFAVLWPSSTPLQAVLGLAVLGLGLGNLFPLALSVTVALAPGRAQLASGRAVMITSAAVLIAPLTVGSLADATSITAALAVVPVMLVLAAVGLTAVIHSTRSNPPDSTKSSRPVRQPRIASRTSGVGRSR